jgi:cell filamentation protein
VTFDPFGDFATEGYLRNVAKEKNLGIVKRLEHTEVKAQYEAMLVRRGNKVNRPT